jgi:hypothetical protein
MERSLEAKDTVRPVGSTRNITPRRLEVWLAVIVLGVAVCLSLAGCGGGEEESEANPEPTMTAALEPTPVPTPQDRRPWSFQGQRGVTVAFPPADVGFYRSLLPESFDMPDQPLVAVSVVDYYDVTLPLVPYREGYVALQCQYQGRTGWHVVTMPVDDETSSAGGRAIGFPKYVADEITLEEQEGGWSGRVVYEGRTVMEIAFTATGSAAPATEGGGSLVFQLLPPGEGPAVYEVNTVASGERSTVATPGSATVRADAGEPWAGLLGPEGSAVWASFEEVTGNWWLEPTQLE